MEGLIKKPLKPDDVLEKIGGFGRYQICLAITLGYMKITRDGFQLMIATFLAAEPAWRCVSNSSSCNITGSISPGQEGYKLRCSLPRSQWEFDTSEFTSIVSEWGLVCNSSNLASVTKSVVFAGYMVGIGIGGTLSDKYGRKPLIYFPSILCTVLALAASFVNAFWIFTLLRGIVGLCIGAASPSSFVLMVENVGVKHRAGAAVCLTMSFGIGMMLIALMGYLLRDWRTLSMATALPGSLAILFWWSIQESSRWLIVKGKDAKATTNFKKVAKFNRKEMPDNPIEFVEEKQRVGDVRDLFRSLKMTRITLVISFSWIVVSMVYYGASFSAEIFGADRYLVFFFMAAIELPADFSAIFLMNRAGRKKVMSLGLIIAALASLGAVLLERETTDSGYFVGRVILAVAAKYFISISFDTAYVFTSELFPTVVRSVGLGFSSGTGRIGSISAPFVVWLVRVHPLLPYSIFAITAFIAGLLSLTLPETNNKPTKEIFELKNNDKSKTDLVDWCQETEI